MRSQRGGDSDCDESEGRDRESQRRDAIDPDARYEPPECEQHRSGEDREHRSWVGAVRVRDHDHTSIGRGDVGKARPPQSAKRCRIAALAPGLIGKATRKRRRKGHRKGHASLPALATVPPRPPAAASAHSTARRFPPTPTSRDTSTPATAVAASARAILPAIARHQLNRASLAEGEVRAPSS